MSHSAVQYSAVQCSVVSRLRMHKIEEATRIEHEWQHDGDWLLRQTFRVCSQSNDEEDIQWRKEKRRGRRGGRRREGKGREEVRRKEKRREEKSREGKR